MNSASFQLGASAKSDMVISSNIFDFGTSTWELLYEFQLASDIFVDLFFF